ncbi:hypothetical protein [Hydrogenophaga sp.]|uniref:hypothetical protein n=1 Tax=Hydrogenophaga sp. TaxID=1904254 RepID=UPI0027319501|nr:hypothetical protein [Hydrogenophaga sp.]MDP1684992.1 hypothetical protein [Hydrogenophaga sp.]
MFASIHHRLFKIIEALQQSCRTQRAAALMPCLFMLLVLALQNGLYFWRHLFEYGIFPNDFLLTYHAVPYYLVEAAKLGKETSWIPFQGMGYPAYMNLQSGFDYLPIRMLSWFGATYTFELATRLQIAHVFLGAVGAAVCARTLGMKWWQAILAGVFYQGFGGFYSNAQHPDIVRAFALLPWLCTPVFMDWKDLSRLQWMSILLLPFWVFMQWTGAYPGSTVAVLFVLGFITVTRAAIEKQERATGVYIVLAMLAGTLLASMTILPAIADAREIKRSTEVGFMEYDYLVASDLLSLVFPITDDRLLSHDLSMRSLLVGIPVVVLFLLGMLRWQPALKWPLVALSTALLISCGLLHPMLTTLIPPLGVSRFVMADYRGIICLVVILVACASLQGRNGQARRMLPLLPVALLLIGGTFFFDRTTDAEWTLWNMDFVIVGVCAIGGISLMALTSRGRYWPSRLMLLATLFALGWLVLLALTYLIGVTLVSPRFLWLAAALLVLLVPLSSNLREHLPHLTALALLVLGVYYVRYLYTVPAHGQLPILLALSIPFALSAVVLWILPGPSRWLIPVLLTAASVMNWSAVHWDQRYFLAHPNDGLSWVEAHAGKFDETRPRLLAALESGHCRTGRKDISGADQAFAWNGYYTGEHYMRDYSGPLKLARQAAILTSDVSRTFAQAEWIMLALPRAVPSDAGTLDLAGATPIDATCISSGTAGGQIRFHLDKPSLVVENEIYWDGWTAHLSCIDCSSSQQPVQLTAVEAGGFRAWQLPAGSYEMKSQFKAPHRGAALVATILGLVLWILLLLLLMSVMRRPRLGGLQGQPS